MGALLDLSNTKPDFENFTSQLQQNLQGRGSWTDIQTEATGETLVEFNSAVGTMDQWAIEKAFKEAFIQTSTNDSSIYAGTRFLGVRISRKIPGTQKCTLVRVNNINLPITGTLNVLAYNQFYINDSIPFFNRGILNFADTANTLYNVQLNQGLVLTKTLISDGLPFLQLTLPALSPFSISDIDIQVKVGSDVWTIISDGLWRYGSEDKVVEDATLGSGDVILQFGNGQNGMIPPYGAAIQITYVETLGSKQSLIANNSSITSAFTQDGFVIQGTVLKDSSINLTDLNLNAAEITLTSTSDAITYAYLPTEYSWDISCVGLQLDAGSGLGLVVGVAGNKATISVVSAFEDTILSSGSWVLSLPATGFDEKPASYYQIMAPSLKRAGNRAVTPPDHSAIFLSYPGISDVLVRTEKDMYSTETLTKSPATIAREIALGVYVTGEDTYNIVKNPNPALYNVIWVSLLTQSGSILTNSEKQDILTWFAQKQLSGPVIKFQDPIKNFISLQVNLKCLTTSDPILVKNDAEVLIQNVFKTDKRVLSKRITTSDLYKVLSDGLKGQLDSFEVFYILDGVTIALSDSLLIPSAAGIASNGFPIPPGYLSLYSLNISSSLTDR